MTIVSPAAGDLVTVPSRLFGPMHVRRNSWITFVDGLLGFGGERRFLVLPSAQAGIYWLQDVGDGNVAFLTIDPFAHFPDYAPRVDDASEDEDRAAQDGEVSVLCIVTLPTPGAEAGPTANLQAPLVMDFESRTGRQVILASGSYHTRHPVTLPARAATDA